MATVGDSLRSTGASSGVTDILWAADAGTAFEFEHAALLRSRHRPQNRHPPCFSEPSGRVARQTSARLATGQARAERAPTQELATAGSRTPSVRCGSRGPGGTRAVAYSLRYERETNRVSTLDVVSAGLPGRLSGGWPGARRRHPYHTNHSHRPRHVGIAAA